MLNAGRGKKGQEKTELDASSACSHGLEAQLSGSSNAGSSTPPPDDPDIKQQGDAEEAEFPDSPTAVVHAMDFTNRRRSTSRRSCDGEGSKQTTSSFLQDSGSSVDWEIDSSTLRQVHGSSDESASL